MIKIINALILITTIGIVSCNTNNGNVKNKKTSNIDTVRLEGINLNDIQKRIIIGGDSIAYKELSRKLDLELRHSELLYYSQLMCNKYKDAGACYMCYRINSDVMSPGNLKTNDTITYKLGIYYLLKSYEMGDRDARFEVIDIYGAEKEVPKSIEFLKEFAKK